MGQDLRYEGLVGIYDPDSLEREPLFAGSGLLPESAVPLSLQR